MREILAHHRHGEWRGRKNVSLNEIYLIYVLRKLIVRAGHKYFSYGSEKKREEPLGRAHCVCVRGCFSLLPS